MAKRVAEKELNHDNWDQEDEEEEAGHFKIASDEDLSKRKIIKAKRRVNSSDKQGGGIFQGFSGFAGLNNNSKGFGASSFAIKPFTGITSLSSGSSLMFSGVKPTSTETSTSLSLGKDYNQNGFKASSDNPQGQKPSSSSYKDNIKALNESVAAWIQKHIDKNPYVDLTPIFNDYKEHMKNIDSKFSASTNETEACSSAAPVSGTTNQPTVMTSASLFSNLPQPTQKKEENSSGVVNTDGESSAQEPAANEPGVSGEETVPEDEVPKPQSVVVAEEGAFHSIKCKLFFKRGSSWAELGIGMLNLKKIERRTQVLVRNDTTLGKIILNVYLAESTPISRSGKNNVILVSVPNPPLYTKDNEGDNSKPATYLIRVKTAEDADELFAQLNTNKPSSN